MKAWRGTGREPGHIGSSDGVTEGRCPVRVRSVLLKGLMLATLMLAANAAVEPSLPFAFGDATLRAKYAYYRQNAASFDTLFLGSSRVTLQVDPRAFDLAAAPGLQTASFNFGINGMALESVHALFSQLLTCAPANLKYVIVEVQTSRNTIQAKDR